MSDQTTALKRIVAVCSNSRGLSEQMLRVFDIAMQGLGTPSRLRTLELQAAIQRKRDRRAAEIAADVALQGSSPWS
jgi:glutamine synthetase adenylyltransferase